MLHHWLNELMNLLADNSRYRHYGPAAQRGFVLGFLIFLLLPLLLA